MQRPAEDELYRLPLAEFTRARDELARRLRREGRREEADAVKALRKPNVAAWAVNQLAHRRPEDIERLLAAGSRLREAQQALLAGGGRAALQEASAEERELVDRLTRDAAAVAGESSTAAAGTLTERIRSTLHAAALDEETASELAAGRLVRDREAMGLFGTGAPAEVRPARARRPEKSAAPRRRAGSDEQQRSAERRREAEQELAAATSAERTARREHAAATKAAERAGRRAEDARARADDARARADQARVDLREAEQREREAAKAQARAARAVATAEKKLE
jgi:hypothetical protein